MTSEVPPDYSVWLAQGDHLAAEELAWAVNQESKAYAQYVGKVIEQINHPLPTVLELGCGTGWVPTHLKGIRYVGVDGNEGCVKIARTKTPFQFVCADLRTFMPDEPVDIICAFAVLKHFALFEWDDVIAKVLRHGQFGIFTMNTAERDVDDFRFGFPHTHVSRARIHEAVWKAGHEVLSIEMSIGGGDVEPVIFTARR